MSLANCPSAGLIAGSRIHIADLGVVGFACVSSDTWREAIECWTQFQRLLPRGLEVEQSFHVDAERAILRLAPLVPLSEQAHGYLVDEWLGSWHRWLGAAGIPFTAVRLSTSRAPHLADYERALGCTVAHDASADEIHLSREALSVRPEMANDSVHRMLVEQCRKQLAQKESLLEQVKREVEALAYQRVDSDRIAERLRVSTRTVRRNLAHRGTSYHDVVMEQRMTLAKRYLKDPSVPIKQISSTLGYSDISSFHRAFRLHVGLTPGQFRGQSVGAG